MIVRNIIKFMCKAYLISYSIALVYIVYLLTNYRMGPLSEDAGIFRYIFLGGVAISILAISPISALSGPIIITQNLAETIPKISNFWKLLFYPEYNKDHGIIYLLQRDDGVYKIGRTNNLRDRLIQLENTYKQTFSIIKVWYVEDSYHYERMALQITDGCNHFEIGHKELRDFNKNELELFMIAFDRIVRYCE